MKFAGGNTTNQKKSNKTLNNYILGDIETGTRKQDTKENSN